MYLATAYYTPLDSYNIHQQQGRNSTGRVCWYRPVTAIFFAFFFWNTISWTGLLVCTGVAFSELIFTVRVGYPQKKKKERNILQSFPKTNKQTMDWAPTTTLDVAELPSMLCFLLMSAGVHCILCCVLCAVCCVLCALYLCAEGGPGQGEQMCIIQHAVYCVLCVVYYVFCVVCGGVNR